MGKLMAKKWGSFRSRLALGYVILGVFAWLRSEYEKASIRTIRYRIASKKINSPVRFLFISDVHDCVFGKRQMELLRTMEALAPDFVLVGGDLMVASKTTDITKTISLCREIASRFPVIYRNGNTSFG